ncbi:MAG: chemotaxis protein CheB, partial [Pirellulaceae bacterium]|nr:chemotaxis protein CheB [Pirellulaceae bacterium]
MSDLETKQIDPSPANGDGQSPYVVGIGASAGGLEALERLFRKMPVDTGMAFVVVQHLSPDFVSMMDELLVRQTTLAIHTVTNGMEVAPNSIYLMPPRKEMIISGGRLLLTDKDPSQGLALPIDLFFRSLAQDCGPRAVGVILSGTGSDGSRGIRAIHEAGGLTIVQREDTALFDGMPKSALATGAVDCVLPPDEIGEALGKFATQGIAASLAEEPVGTVSEDAMQRLLRLLREAYGIDFSLYKQSTVLRRIERRLLLSQSIDLDQYVREATSDPSELNTLYRDLLIGVTQFFRDRDAFAVIENDVLPELLRRAPPSEELRAWVAGCATGEEAYSLAILFHEQLTRLGRGNKVKIFATDVHQASLDVASLGIYPEVNLADVSVERRERYFTRHGDRYQVSPELRQMIVFAPHNLVKDAPFTHLDLVSCRNLLIYFQPTAQRKAISLFHFGLKAGGSLFLGPSENVGDLEDEFTPIDRHWKVYRKRRDVRLPSELRLPLVTVPARRGFRSPSGGADLELMRVYDELLDRFMPPGVLVNHHQQVVHVFGEAGNYLRLKPGRTSTDVFDLFDAELKAAVAGAMQRAAKELAPVSLHGLTVSSAQGPRQVKLGVTPLFRQAAEHFLMITIEEETPAAPRMFVEQFKLGEVSSERIATLEHDLRTSRENLQATIEELETSNEELQSTNEELIASNEELQSTNEELHSVNEELYTVNAEYQRKIQELTELTDDMENLLQSTSVGVLFLDRELCIRKFTATVSGLFNIARQDVGRPLENFTHHLEFPEFLGRVKEVLTSGQPFEGEVRDRFDRCHLLRVLPYRSSGKVEGVVITLIDIQLLKDAERELQHTERQLQAILDYSPFPIFMHEPDGRMILLNREAQRLFRVPAEEVSQRNFYDLVPSEAREEIRAQAKKVLDTGHQVQTELTMRLRRARRTFLSVKYPLRNERGEIFAIAGIWTDISIRKRAEQQAQDAVVQRDRFLATLSHELRNPLAAVQHAAQLLQLRIEKGESPLGEGSVIVRQARQMGRLLDDLLDISRISQGKIVLRKERLNLVDPAREALAVVQPLAEQRQVELRAELPDGPLWVLGDSARLQQAQVNLLVNAVKYTPAGGVVNLSLTAHNGRSIIRVRDTGVGMSKRLQRRVFDLFVQADETLDRADGGIGVGLTLVKSLVNLHGGEVTAASPGPGKGSEFTISLPLADQTDQSFQVAPTQASRETLRILIVEDNADAREMLGQLLESHGHVVRTAADGWAALDSLARDDSDVALIDIGLPQIDGYQLAGRIRESYAAAAPV